jgi:hypothetical protein
MLATKYRQRQHQPHARVIVWLSRKEHLPARPPLLIAGNLRSTADAHHREAFMWLLRGDHEVPATIL